jgi:hypothetical protein
MFFAFIALDDVIVALRIAGPVYSLNARLVL